MNVKFSDPLKSWQKPNPVFFSKKIVLSPSIMCPTDEQLLSVFKTAGYKLQTWGRSVDENGKTIRDQDPHWLAIRGSTPLHTDPAYSRYSHHLKMRVDPGIRIRGHNKVEMKMFRGLFYILDTHSPHQVWCDDEKSFQFMAVWDAKKPTNPDKVLAILFDYIARTPFSG